VIALRKTAAEIFTRLEYSPRSTRVDSPIDEALTAQRGVCQDFAHIFIALARHLGVPCRYVSGYLFHEPGSADRSADGATHAWAEVLLPDFGWVGIDPTNNSMAGERHIRVAFGRDYADVPPTRGVYKGVTTVRSELAVSVRVGPAQPDMGSEVLSFLPWMSREAATPAADAARNYEQQQQ
jgi:transglutaminase-like putative cysteine protease